MPQLGFWELLGLIGENHPDIAKILSKPGVLEVALKIVQAEVDGTPWSAQQITDALQATEYYRTTTQEGRTWDILQATDPATAEQTMKQRGIEIMQWASQNGFTMSWDEANYIALDTLSHGLNSAQWQAKVAYQYMNVAGQTPGVVTDQLNALAAQYAVPLSEDTLKKWSQQMLSGQADQATFAAYLQEQAKSLFPGLANALDRGITVAQYVQPYAQIAQQELGINTSDLDWRDQKWSRAIHQIDPKTGDPTAMSLSDWTRELRSNSIYGYDGTIKAQEQAGQLGNALLQRLGFAA